MPTMRPRRRECSRYSGTPARISSCSPSSRARAIRLCLDRGAVDGSSREAFELAERIETVECPHGRHPPFEGELLAVLGKRFLPGPVLGRLRVDDRPVEVEQQRFHSHGAGLSQTRDELSPYRELVCRCWISCSLAAASSAGVPGVDACDSCVRQLPRIAAPLCDRCGAPTAWPVSRCRECAGRRLAFASARAAVPYDAHVRALVAGWKEHGLRGVTALAADVVVEVVARPPVEALAFVPPDAERAFRRGHHPAAALAHALGERWALPDLALLRRTRSVPRQAGLPFTERRRNVAGAFGPAAEAPPSVALVDDVYTTGSTVAAASSALRRAGARRVEVITFARAIR